MMHLHASALAGFVGRHPYCKRFESFEKLWNRVDPVSFARAHARNSLNTPEEKHRALTLKTPALGEAASSRAVDRPVDAVAALTTHVHADESLTADEKREACREIQSSLFTTFGTEQEESALESVRRVTGLDIISGDDVYYKVPLDTTGSVVLGGKIDGLTRDGMQVIEIKNRVRRLFFTAPEYERIQVLAYLALLPKSTHALLVETLRTPDEPVALNIIRVPRDDQLWGTVCEEARDMVKVLRRMLVDDDLQNRYLASKQRSAFLRRQCDSVVTT